MTIVVDSSVIVTALVERGAAGEWAEGLLVSNQLAAPHLMPVEVANILRRSAFAGHIAAEVASLAHEDLLSLPVELFPYHPFAARVWELRGTVTAYDAWYVALAETVGARLATVDVRLSRAAGTRCAFALPPK